MMEMTTSTWRHSVGLSSAHKQQSDRQHAAAAKAPGLTAEGGAPQTPTTSACCTPVTCSRGAARLSPPHIMQS